MANLIDTSVCIRSMEDIKKLKSSYFRYMDSGDWASMLDVFDEDSVMDMRDEVASLMRAGIPVDESSGLTTGRDPIVANMRASLRNAVTIHHGHMPEITLHSELSASGIWALEDILLVRHAIGTTRFHGYGHYHERYMRGSDGRWRIAHLSLTRLHREITHRPR
jgi:hypothetical protein